jgi:hypothetical protein
MKPSRKWKAREREIYRPDFDHAKEIEANVEPRRRPPILRARVSNRIRNLDGWLATMRKVAREVVVKPEIQSAKCYRSPWATTGPWAMPRSGPAVRLFRGAGALERRRGICGPSWSADAAGSRAIRSRAPGDGRRRARNAGTSRGNHLCNRLSTTADSR